MIRESRNSEGSAQDEFARKQPNGYYGWTKMDSERYAFAKTDHKGPKAGNEDFHGISKIPEV